MALDAKYGKVTLEREPASLEDDEPVFVLRAQDALAVEVLTYYRDLYEEGEVVNVEKLVDLRTVMQAFRQWPTKKWPD